MRNCFIPGCDRLCRIKGTIKRKMFVVPKDKETFNAWVDVLPKQRELKAHDKVCERHFDDNDISTTYDNIINGQLYKMERGRPKLKPKAIPSKNFDCAETTRRLNNSVINRKHKIPVEEITAEDTQVYDSMTLEEQELEVDGEVQEITEICLKDTQVPETTTETAAAIVPYELNSDENQVDEGEENEARELFESLYDDIYEVVLPNTLWGVHRCPEHSSIFFSFVDPSMLRTTKMISISCHGEVKILLGSRLMNEQNLMTDIASIESLTALITEIDELLLCSKVFDNEFCEVSIKDSDSEVCDACAQVEIL
ncbi:uncharacterized protein LOC129946377 [Eupeodes corollae]|uniref:uncharacterized protein LOC129946377 n=1 Tax=Eupeodes corollae TaxID=290404 RepID=UPI00249293F8|nr:uncharacterized protein LOC129946377 [Eupeodes corollae]